MSRDMATVHCRMVASSATTTGDLRSVFDFVKTTPAGCK